MSTPDPRPAKRLRRTSAPTTAPGRALQWWLNQLQSPATRRALLENHHHL